ncbi:MAG: hypothetical protein HFG72_09445 [Hungatella sp.]|nr:hypothetical protein [Hungatella sp.]
MRIQWKKLLVVSLAAALLGSNLMSMAQESAQSRTFSVLSVSGDEAYVIKGAGKEVKAAAGMPLGQGTKIRTGPLTSVYVTADEDKTIRLDSNTQVEITKATSKSLKITLKSGEIFFNVDKPLKAGEEMTFDAAQTSMSIRGTSGVLKSDGDTVSLYLLEGKVEWNCGKQRVTVVGGQTAIVRAILDASPAEVKTAQISVATRGESMAISPVRAFQWDELSVGGMEAVLEQKDRLELSAIGLGGPVVSDELLLRLEELKREKEAEERQQMEKEEAARQSAGSGGASVRVDGKEPELPVSEERSSSGGGWSEPETDAPTVVDPPSSTEPPTVVDPPSSTEPPTVVDPPASTEPPTVVDPPSTTDTPATSPDASERPDPSESTEYNSPT